MALRPRPKELDSAVVPKIIRAFSRWNTWLYRVTGGMLGDTLRAGAAFPWGLPLCLLTTTGRKSGVARTTPLLFIEDNGNVIVVASVGGLPSHPLWYTNLEANPEVIVQIKRRIRKMRARTASPIERAALWPRLVSHYADFANYQSWTQREIPVVICEPVDVVPSAG